MASSSAVSSAYIYVTYDLDQWTCLKWVNLHSAFPSSRRGEKIPTYFPWLSMQPEAPGLFGHIILNRACCIHSLFLILLFHSIFMPKKEDYFYYSIFLQKCTHKTWCYRFLFLFRMTNKILIFFVLNFLSTILLTELADCNPKCIKVCMYLHK